MKTTKHKKELLTSEKLSADVKAWLAQGNRITEYPSGVSTEVDPVPLNSPEGKRRSLRTIASKKTKNWQTGLFMGEVDE